MKTVTLPPPDGHRSDGSVVGGWWHEVDETGSADSAGTPNPRTRIVCDLCPRECRLAPGDRGFCFVRCNTDGELRLTTYGRSTGFCIDPIEKKPLNHFLPGTPVLSFGTAGCNLGCRFCQNWDISKSRETERISEQASPSAIAAAAVRTGCRSVAYTYNDPIIWAEYAIDTAAACREAGILNVAVTAGYISPQARPTFFRSMDAANVDLKAFTEDFYQRITYSHLQPVLETLEWLHRESNVWFEITNLLIPDANDRPDEIRRMCDWIISHTHDEVPVHFTAFHPDFRMQDRPATPPETLLKAREIAMQQGLRYVYVGNVHDTQNQSTWCPGCGELLIERDWHRIGRYRLNGNQCPGCRRVIPGRFEEQHGTWGNRRQPIRIGDFSADSHLKTVPLRIPVETQPTNSPDPEPQISPDEQCPDLTPDERQAVHDAASDFVLAASLGRSVPDAPPAFADCEDRSVTGIFVTLKDQGRLRGCCGTLGTPMKLGDALRHAAHRTAVADPRFPPVRPEELPGLTLDVTLLFHFEKITASGADRVAEVEVGRHGLKISMNGRSGLLLPSVATEFGWDARTFLNQVCRKAGLPDDAWLDNRSELERFEGSVIEGRFNRPLPDRHPDSADGPPHLLSEAETTRLLTVVTANIEAALRGAVTSPFPSSVPDGDVNGVVIRTLPDDSESAHISCRLSPARTMPLQSTIDEVVRETAQKIRALSQTDADRRIRIDIAVFCGARRISGPGAAPSECRSDTAVLVVSGQNFAWQFSDSRPVQDIAESLCSTVREASGSEPEVTLFAVRSSCRSLAVSSIRPQPPPVPGNGLTRTPAVAGQFYPADAPGLQSVIRECIGTEPENRIRCAAVMVPHAGLRFSGSTAAEIWKSIEIPQDVIVISPKHTRRGAGWSVGPFAQWEFPGGFVSGNMPLVRRLADSIDGLEAEPEAHAEEHGIEVQLPFLHHFSPDSSLVGIAVGAGSAEECIEFGRRLADVIRPMQPRPLLVISSDMNHFAPETENRRLDRMALDAMQTCDPRKLYDVVTGNRISMCGMLPAVIVMEAMRQLDGLDHIEVPAYTTSAAVTGDVSRVVGYAGAVLHAH